MNSTSLKNNMSPSPKKNEFICSKRLTLCLTKCILATFIIGTSLQKCVLYGEDCDASTDPNCAPRLAVGDEIEPQINEYEPGDNVCPDYEGKKNCCNKFSMRAMKNNYGLLDQTLGDPSNGCGICATNLKRFW